MHHPCSYEKRCTNGLSFSWQLAGIRARWNSSFSIFFLLIKKIKSCQPLLNPAWITAAERAAELGFVCEVSPCPLSQGRRLCLGLFLKCNLWWALNEEDNMQIECRHALLKLYKCCSKGRQHFGVWEPFQCHILLCKDCTWRRQKMYFPPVEYSHTNRQESVFTGLAGVSLTGTT